MEKSSRQTLDAPVSLGSLLEFPSPPTHPCPVCAQVAFGPPHKECAACLDFRFVRKEKDEALEATVSTIPELFRDATLEWPLLSQYVQPPRMIALAKAELVAPPRPPCAIFSGFAGTGKTTLAVALMRAWSGTHHQVALFVTARKLASARGQFPLGHGEPPLVEEALRAPLLVIDDWGHETALYNSAFEEVIFERHSRRRPTWVTTWIESRAEASKRYNDGLVRRLYEAPAALFHLHQDGG